MSATDLLENAPPASPAANEPEGGLEDQIESLPTYTRSLLRIKVPVVVTLASSRHSVGRILEIGPGTMLSFNKPCEEPLVLSVGRTEVAHGEAVKVGEKFGLRVTAMVMPQEKFEPVRPPSAHRA